MSNNPGNTVLVIAILAVVVILGLVALIAFILYSRRVISDPLHYRRLMEQAQLMHGRGDVKGARKRYVKVTKGIQRVKALTPDLKLILGNAFLAIGHIDRSTAPTAAVASYREAARWIALPAEVVEYIARDYAAHNAVTPEAIDTYLLHLSNTHGQDAKDPVLQFLMARTQVDALRETAQFEFVEGLAERILEVEPALEWARFALGRALEQLGRFDQAIVAFLAAEKMNPARAATSFHLALIYSAQSKVDLAQDAFHRTLQVDAAQPEALYRLAEILIGKATATAEPALSPLLQEALGHLASACDLAPQDGRIWHLRGHAYILRKQPKAARAPLTRAASLEPNNIGYQMALAELLIGLKDGPAAIAALRQAIVADPKHVGAHGQLAHLLFAASDFIQAEAEYRQVLGLAPQSDEGRIGLGRSLYEQNRFTDAITQLRQVKQPNEESTFALARAFGKNNQPAEAVGVLRGYLKSFPARPEVSFYLGCAHARLSEWEPALKAFQEAEQGMTEATPLRIDALFYRGVVLVYMGKLDEAGIALQAASKIAPQNPQVAYAQGVLAACRRDVKGAREAFTRSLSLDPRFASAHFGLGILDEQAGNSAEAVKAFQAGLSAEPNWVPAHARLGIAQAKAQAWADAVTQITATQAMLNKGKAPGVNREELLFYLGLAQAQIGKAQEALAAWKGLHDHYPNDAELAGNIAHLYYLLGKDCFDRKDYTGAIDHWEESLRLRVADPVRVALAEAHIRLGAQLLFGESTPERRAQAVAQFVLARNLTPKEPRIRLYLGIEALISQDPGRAIQFLQPLTDENPQDDRVTYFLAWARLAKGDTEAALALLGRLEPVAKSYSPQLQIARANAAVAQGRYADALALYSHSLQV